MRVLLRSALMAMLATIAALMAWSFLQRPSSAGTVSAASGLPVPVQCVPPELPGLQALLAGAQNGPARQFLQGKANAAQQAALDCAASQAAHPPAPKPARAALLPTEVPEATPTLAAGIQHAELVPSEGFLPSDAGNNMWTGTINGHALQAFAGSLTETDPNWQQDHPDWVAHPEQHVQGALRLVVDSDSLHANLYATPGRHGTLQFVNACGATLVLQAADGTVFSFDTAASTYIHNDGSCPAPTP